MARFSFEKMLTETREIFGDAPRHVSFWDRWTCLRVARPNWIRSDGQVDKIERLFANYPRLWSEGTVVWGQIVQANSLLFEPGPDNCPGEMIYSLETRRPVTPNDLIPIARALFDLKHTEPDDPEEAKIARHLTNERTRLFGARVPATISQVPRCRFSTTYFVRKHLPLGRLACPALPVVVVDEEPHVIAPLPARYWSQSLLEWWQAMAD